MTTIRVRITALEFEAKRIYELLARDFEDEGNPVTVFESSPDGRTWTAEILLFDMSADEARDLVRDRLGADAFAAPVEAEPLAELPVLLHDLGELLELLRLLADALDLALLALVVRAAALELLRELRVLLDHALVVLQRDLALRVAHAAREVSLRRLALEHVLLEGVGRRERVDERRPRLAVAPDARRRLVVVGRVPRRLEQYQARRAREREAHAAGLERQQQQEDAAVRVVERGGRVAARVERRRAVDARAWAGKG